MIALTSTVASSHHGLAHAAVRAALLCGLALLASSCANRAEQYRLEDAAQRAEMAKRKAGETRLATLAEVTPTLGCGGSRARAQIDSAEVLPARARPGTEITHRFVYSACDGGARPLRGTLVRKLILNRRTVFEEKRPMSLKPGRWAVDVFIGIPPNAEPGWYGVEITFEHEQVPLYNWQYFQLLPRS
jgi:hypothetical protein